MPTIVTTVVELGFLTNFPVFPLLQAAVASRNQARSKNLKMFVSSPASLPATEMSVCSLRDSSLFCSFKHEPIKLKTSPSVDLLHSENDFQEREYLLPVRPSTHIIALYSSNLRFHTVRSVLCHSVIRTD